MAMRVIDIFQVIHIHKTQRAEQHRVRFFQLRSSVFQEYCTSDDTGQAIGKTIAGQANNLVKVSLFRTLILINLLFQFIDRIH